MRLARFAWIVLAWVIAVVLWGAVVRATGSGAGCGAHWPLCNGEVLPRAPAVATLIEWSHRATSGLALLAVVALAVAVFRSRPRGDATRLGAVLSVVFILSEAAVGAGLVLFRLVADDDSTARALAMVVHLANTFLLLGALALTAHWAGGGRPLRLRRRGAVLVWVLLALGGILAVGKSGAVAALGDTLFPAESLAHGLAQDLSPTSHLLLRLRLLHPTLAVAVSALLLLVAFRLPDRAPSPPRAQRWATAAIALTLLQLVAGVVNVALLAPVWMQVLHLLLADLLWLATVLLAAEVLAAPSATPGG
jgi:heme A synthase